jgi:DNA polymerase IIIc chi subunit
MLELGIMCMVIAVFLLAVVWDLGCRYLARKDVTTVADALQAYSERQDAITKTFLASVVELITCTEADKKTLREKYVSAGLRAKV